MNGKAFVWVVLVNLLLLLVLAVQMPRQMISPGKPIDAHAELQDDCFACHTPFFGSSPEKCVKCHKVEEIGLVTTQGVSIARERKRREFDPTLAAVKEAAAGIKAETSSAVESRLKQMEEVLTMLDGIANKLLSAEDKARAVLAFLAGSSDKD